MSDNPERPAASAEIAVPDIVSALAFVGDLSMGQPVDHSLRTAWMAWQLARLAGCDEAASADTAAVALLRWSGCTANAQEFADLLGDDVQGRKAMLAETSLPDAARIAATVAPMMRIHCEVSGEIAHALGLSANVQSALRNIFEAYDGSGQPRGLRGESVPHEVFVVGIAGDLEILARTHGLKSALQALQDRTDRRYPAQLTELAGEHATEWMDSLDQGSASMDWLRGKVAMTRSSAPIEWIADVVDLKAAWMAGFSRKVASTAASCAKALGMSPAQQARVYRAGLIHGIGRSSVPNAIWESSSRRSEAEIEQLRLAPYWTQRAGRRIRSLEAEAELASFIEERCDGSGHFRGMGASGLSPEAHTLIVALRHVWLTTARPGVAALTEDDAIARLQDEAQAGALDASVVDALANGSASGSKASTSAPAASTLTPRELEILRQVSLGQSNKEVARTLSISPSTVRAHLESVFRKLDCTTRAAATFKAFSSGLL